MKSQVVLIFTALENNEKQGHKTRTTMLHTSKQPLFNRNANASD